MEDINRLEDLESYCPSFPGVIEVISQPTLGTPTGSAALDAGFNALDSANVRATVSKAMRSTARTLVAKRQEKHH